MPRTIWTQTGIICLVISLLDNLAIAVVIPLLPTLAAAAGAEPGRWVWILAVNGVVLTLGPFVWGRVITTANAATIISGTLIVKAVCVLTLPIPSLGWEWLLINRAISGGMSGTTIATQLWLVSQSSDTSWKARAIAALSVAVSIGIGLGALFAAATIQIGDATNDFSHVAAEVALLLSAVLILLSFGVYLTPDGRPERTTPPAANLARFEADPRGRLRVASHGPVRYHQWDAFAVMVVNTLARVSSFAFPVMMLLTAEQDHRLSMSMATAVISILSFLEIPSQFIVPRLIAQTGYRAATLTLLILSGLSVSIPAYALTEHSAVLSAILFALSGGALQSVLRVYLTELREEIVPWWLGVSQGMVGAARAAAPVMAAVLFAHGTEFAFISIALISLLGLPLVPAIASRPSLAFEVASSGR